MKDGNIVHISTLWKYEICTKSIANGNADSKRDNKFIPVLQNV